MSAEHMSGTPSGGHAPLRRGHGANRRSASPLEARAQARPFIRLLVRAALLAVAIGGLFAFGREIAQGLPQLLAWVRAQGAWAPLIFVTVYALGVVAFVPGAVMTAAAGVLFGVVRGTALVLVAATLGAGIAFALSRRFARGAVARWIARDARFAAIDEAVRCQGLRIVFLLRLSPVVPFNLLNYGLGATRVRARDYVLASIGMLPGTLLYVYSGRVAGELVSAAGGAAAPRGLASSALLAVGFVATLLVTVVITRIARGALREATNL